MDSRIATAFSVRERVLLEKIHVAQRRLCLNDYNYYGFFPFSETIERTDLVTKMYFENSLVSRFSFNAKFADIARRLDWSSGHYFGVFWLHQGSLSPVHSEVRFWIDHLLLQTRKTNCLNFGVHSNGSVTFQDNTPGTETTNSIVQRAKPFWYRQRCCGYGLEVYEDFFKHFSSIRLSNGTQRIHRMVRFSFQCQ